MMACNYLPLGKGIMMALYTFDSLAILVTELLLIKSYDFQIQLPNLKLPALISHPFL